MFRIIALNPTHLIIMLIIVLALSGFPYSLMFDHSYLVTYAKGVSPNLVTEAYLWTVYAFSVFMILYYVLRINNKIATYQSREITLDSKRKYTLIWLGLFGGAFICAFILFQQNKFSHPMLTAIGLDQHSFAVKRIIASKAVSPIVYNLGLKIFAAFALFMAMFVLKKFWLSLITLVLTITLATFSLQKSPLAQTLLQLLFIYLLLNKPKLKSILILIGLMVCSLATLYYLAKTISSLGVFVPTLIRRLTYYQFADLPYYFELFSRHKLDFMSMVSPQVQALFGHSWPSASKLVMDYMNPRGVAVGTAGVTDQLFIGEAYAAFGVWGIIVSPVWIALHYALTAYIFSKLPKNIYTVFIFGYILTRMTLALFSGFSYFVCSSTQILILSCLFYLLLTKKLRRVNTYRGAS